MVVMFIVILKVILSYSGLGRLFDDGRDVDNDHKGVKLKATKIVKKKKMF